MSGKRIGQWASAAVAVALVGGIAAGVTALTAPAPVETVETVSYERPASLFADTLTTSPSSELAEAERLEAERVAAEAAAAAQAEADRLAAEQAAAEQQAQQVEQSAPVQQAPQQQAPAPAPAPVVEQPEPVDPGPGDQQAGECREYNDNNECTAWYVP